jgi:hypothetical protein
LQRRGHRRSLELKGRRERHRERPKNAGTARRSAPRGQRRNTDGALKRDFSQDRESSIYPCLHPNGF